LVYPLYLIGNLVELFMVMFKLPDKSIYNENIPLQLIKNDWHMKY